MPVKAMTMPCLSQQSMTASSRMEPPGSATYRTPERKARSMLSEKGKKASEPRATSRTVSRYARCSALVKGSGWRVKYRCQTPSAVTSSSFWLI